MHANEIHANRKISWLKRALFFKVQIMKQSSCQVKVITLNNITLTCILKCTYGPMRDTHSDNFTQISRGNPCIKMLTSWGEPAARFNHFSSKEKQITLIVTFLTCLIDRYPYNTISDILQWKDNMIRDFLLLDQSSFLTLIFPKTFAWVFLQRLSFSLIEYAL